MEWIRYFDGRADGKVRERRIEFIRAIFSVPSQFERGIVRLNLWPTQERYLRERGQRNNVTKSRRIGFSTAVQAGHVTDFLFDGGDNLIVGERGRTTKKLLALARRFVADAALAFPRLVPEILVDNTESIIFAHPRDGLPYKGIHAMTAGRSGTRSFGAARIHKTEMAYWLRAEEVNASVMGSDEGDTVEDEESTPKGRVNLFARHALGYPDPNDFNKFVFDWRSNPNFTDEWARGKKANLGPVLFAQEYECDFVQSGNPVFDDAILGEAVPWIGGEDVPADHPARAALLEMMDSTGFAFWAPPSQPDDLPYAWGVDCAVGRPGGDNAVAYCTDSRTGKQVAEIRGILQPDVFGRKIDRAAKFYRGRVLVEENGPGEAVLLELKNLGTPNVARFHTGKNKEVLIHRWEQALRTGEATICSGATIEEHRTFVYVFSETSGNVKMEAIPPYHDDGVIAGALAHRASVMPLAGVA